MFGSYGRHFLEKVYFLIQTSIVLFGIFCIKTVSAGALDFYSTIDDAGDTIASGLTTRHLQEYPTFRSFGKNCRTEAPWLDTTPMNEEFLQKITNGNYSDLTELAQNKNITLTTDQLHNITSCLAETYLAMQSESRTQQAEIEIGGVVGIYNDGSLANSDYDIISDIEQINKILFMEAIPYNGRTNPTNASLGRFLSGERAPTLKDNNSSDTSGSESTNSNANANPNANSGTNSNGGSSQTAPWADICLIDATTNSTVDTMVNTNFLDELRDVLAGNNTPGNSAGGQDYSVRNNTNTNSNNSSNASSEKDFFHTPACEGIFCITIGTIGNNTNLLGGGLSNSIETILTKHIEKTLPISWTDLSGQKMTKNFWKLPFLNLPFSSKVAGGGLFMHDKPQLTKRFVTEETPVKQDATFDAAYRCALISAGLSLDELKAAGVTGAGYAFDAHTTITAENASLPLNAIDKERLQAENDCNTLYQDVSREQTESAWSTEIGELHAFSRSIMDIILQILDTEMKLDSVKAQ